MTIQELQSKADYIRKEIIRVACKNGAGHIAPSLSCVDILVTLYYHIMWPFKDFVDMSMKILPSIYEDRDRFILSKAHGCYGLYAILCDLGIIPKKIWEDMGKSTSILKGCCEYKPEFGLEAGCGSLGHGLPMAVGLAYGAGVQKKEYKVYCLVGDGELQEGSNWEAMEFACNHMLDNLVIIVDVNELQAMSETPYNRWDIAERAEAFGCDVCYVDGHDIDNMVSEMENLTTPNINPLVIVAETIKGKGLKCMEGVMKFHYRIPTKEELRDE